MMLQEHFVFFDFEEPLLLFVLDYAAAMGFFVFAGHCLDKIFTHYNFMNIKKKKEGETTMKRKLLSLILVGTMTIGMLAGCGSRSRETDTEAVLSEAQTETQTQAAAAADTAAATGSDVLVVYYSATGNTEAVANAIADATGGDLFELEPAEPYTSEDLDWTNEESRVTLEHEDESLRDVELVSTEVEGWDSYDTVFIGYPIWWGIAAWPVDSFVENNDFTGKTVIPFCTSASSGIGDSGNLLAEMAGTGDWQEGERFQSGADAADVQAWVDGLGL